MLELGVQVAASILHPSYSNFPIVYGPNETNKERGATQITGDSPNLGVGRKESYQVGKRSFLN